MRSWVNTVFILTSLKTEIARSARGPKSQGPRAEDVLAEPYLVEKILVTSLQQITKFSVKVVNLDTIPDLQTWCKTWPPNGSSHIRAKQKTSQETQRSLQKFLESNRKPTVTYTDNSLEFGKACEDLSWNHRTSTPHRSETNGIAERAVRVVKEGTSAVLLQTGLVEYSMECFTYLRNIQDLLSVGKTPCERRFGEPFKGPIHSVWFISLTITLSLRKTSQESINLERKSYLDCSLDTLCTRGEVSKGDILVCRH